MSAIGYCEEAFAILRATLASELAGIVDANTALLHTLNDPASHRDDAIKQARAVQSALAEMAVGYSPTPTQERRAANPSHPPTPKPEMPPPPVVVAPVAPAPIPKKAAAKPKAVAVGKKK